MSNSFHASFTNILTSGAYFIVVNVFCFHLKTAFLLQRIRSVSGSGLDQNERHRMTIIGELSYTISNGDFKEYDSFHFRDYGCKESHNQHQYFILKTMAGVHPKFFRGVLNMTAYFEINNIPYAGTPNLESTCNYLKSFGWNSTSKFRIDYAEKFPILTSSEFLDLGNDVKKPLVLVLTHDYGGGTRYFENNLIGKFFHTFIFLRFVHNSQRRCSIRIFKGLELIYTTAFIDSPTKIENLFKAISPDLMIICYLHYYVELFKIIARMNVPLVYVFHDHHAATLSEDAKQIYCMDDNDPLLEYEVYRGDIKKVLQRCLLITTPSDKAVQVMKRFFPDLAIYSAPYRPILNTASLAAIHVRPLISSSSSSSKTVLKIVAIGDLSIGKGSLVAQDLSVLGEDILEVHHIGKAINVNLARPSLIRRHGGYTGKDDLFPILEAIDPDVVWFPAIHHETYCYVLDLVIPSKYPIITSSTGSFPERLTGRPQTWVVPGCLDGKGWYFFFQDIWNRKQPPRLPPVHTIKKPVYDFESFDVVLEFLHQFLSRHYNQTVIKEGLRGSDWVDFLALNPSVVFNNVSADQSFVEQQLTARPNEFKLVNRLSLDETFFRNHQQNINITRSIYPFNDVVSSPMFNRLQWVSPASLVLVWHFLARNLPTYTAWYRQQSRTKNKGFKYAALLIDPRYSEATFAVTMNVMYHLGPGWNLYIHCSEGCDRLRADFRGYHVNFVEMQDLPMGSKDKVSYWLTRKRLWCAMREQRVLVYQVDSLLHRPNLDIFLKTQYPFLGAFGPGVGTDLRTPKGVAINGGLSLRSPRAMCDCLTNITHRMVNQYRKRFGLPTEPHHPHKGVFMTEDLYFYHALELLSYPSPPLDVLNSFSVQDIYHLNATGLHGYDKGWYLTTAQLYLLLSHVLKT